MRDFVGELLIEEQLFCRFAWLDITTAEVILERLAKKLPTD
jgi:hypothetical protein